MGIRSTHPIAPLRRAVRSLFFHPHVHSGDPQWAVLHYMSYWQDKVCVVAGGSAGLGLAIGRALAKRNARVVLIGRRQDALDAAAGELQRAGGNVTPIAGDMAWQEDVDRVAAEVTEKFGRVEMLCNCAGRSTRGKVLDAAPEDFQQLFEANFYTMVRATRAFAPLLLKSRGHLVNIGSLASKVAPRYTGAYPASKFAIAAYTQQLRLELGDQGVHAMLVCPGPFTREDNGKRYAADGVGVPAAAQAPGAGAHLKTLDPDYVAERILKACEQRRADLVIPAKVRILCALSQLSASWGDWLLTRSTK
ncbi:3-oxoacyl reductase [Lacipirellula parvula]|uniref:3-oxoacyl reductase n=2 Tax=Lacipirellula parvula TaxID=2650471 RepID=A0A5K7XBD2_9BACT|nr:3-oxoacyl reductase [Lacipirellula parvula]